MRVLSVFAGAALLTAGWAVPARSDIAQALTPTKVLSRKNADNTWLTDGGVVQKVVLKGQAQWRFSNWQEYLGDYPELSEFVASRKLDDVREFVAVGPVLVGLFGPYAQSDGSQRYEFHSWHVRGNYAVEALRRNLGFTVPQGCSLVTMRSIGPYLAVDGVACATPTTLYFRIFDDGVVQGPYRGTPDLTAEDGVLPDSRFWVFDAQQGGRVLQTATFDERARTVGIQALRVKLDYTPAAFKSGQPQVQVFASGSAVIKAGRTVGLGRLSAGARFLWKYYQLPESLAEATFRLAGRTNLVLVSKKAGVYDFYSVPSQQLFEGEKLDVVLPLGGLANPGRRFTGLACTVEGVQAYDATYAQIATRMPDDTWQLSTDTSSGSVVWSQSEGNTVARIVVDKNDRRFEVSQDLKQWKRALGAPLDRVLDFDASGSLMMVVGGEPRALYSSVDAGATWVQLPSPEGYTPMEVSLQSEGGRNGAVLFRGDDGSYAITRTGNGGMTWSAEAYTGRGACSGVLPDQLAVLDTTTMMTRAGVTYDGGKSWQCPNMYGTMAAQITSLRVLPGTDYALIGSEKGLFLTDGLGDGFEKAGFFTGSEPSAVREMCRVGPDLVLRHDGGFAQIANLRGSRQACYKKTSGADAGRGGCAYIDQYSVLGARKAMVAAYSNDLVTFKELYRVQADPAFRSPDGYTYALTAASGGATDVLLYLMGTGSSAGVNPDAHNDLSSDGRTALLMAAQAGRTAAVSVILAAGLSDTKPWRGKYAYELAEAAGHTQTGGVIRAHMLAALVTEAMRQRSVPLFRDAVQRFQAWNATVGDQPILHLAAQTGDVPLCQMLLTGGSDPAQRNGQNLYAHEMAASLGAQAAATLLRTALYDKWVREAYAKSDWPRIGQLIREGADPNVRVEGDLPLVSAAAEAAQNAVISDIAARAGDLNAVDAAKFLPVDYAIRSGKIETVRLVVANMADKKPALHPQRIALLLTQRKYDVLDVLLGFGADPNGVSLDSAKTGDGETVLIAAARQGDTRAIELLAKYKANLELPTRAGRTALIAAAMEGKDAAVLALLRAGARIDAQDAQGNTALHWATRRQQLTTVKTLVLSKANLKLKTAEGDTAEDLADALGFPEIEDYLDSVD